MILHGTRPFKILWQLYFILSNFYFLTYENHSFTSLRSMAVLLSRAQERRSREKNKNRLPGFVAFSTAAPFNSFWHPVNNLFGFSFPSQSEIKCWQPNHDTKARDIFQVASAPISSRFLCPRPPLLLSAPNQNRHATQATSTMKFINITVCSQMVTWNCPPISRVYHLPNIMGDKLRLQLWVFAMFIVLMGKSTLCL